MLKFLDTYTPANEGFTTKAEMETIANALNFALDDLNELRNNVVEFYSKKLAFLRENGYDYGHVMEAMWSVTATIDYYKIKRGMEV